MTELNNAAENTNTTTEELVAQTEALGTTLLGPKAKLPEVIEKLNEIIAKLNEFTTVAQPKVRDRGPDSQREMTEDDARQVLLGDLKELSHKEAALKLGLSYGQIYSSRKGFTFKGVYKEFRDLQNK